MPIPAIYSAGDNVMSEEDENESVVFTVSAEDAGGRLDAWLAARCAGMNLSRSRLKELILGGAAEVNGESCANPSLKIKAGMEISLLVPPPEDAQPMPENIPLNVVYEDDDLLVIDKAPGMVVHPAPGHATGTLVNALLHHCGNTLSGIGGVRRPGIVHRLDKDTGGLMVVAKNDAAHQGLSAQLSGRELSRVYKALCWSVPQPRKGTVDQPVGRHHIDRQRMTVTRRNGRDAVTHYLVEERFGPAAALLECRLETGRTHQIRVHMAYIKHPLVGDPVYGAQKTAASSLLKKGGFEEGAKEAILAFPRQALHAAAISFIHPATGEEMQFESLLPDDFAGLINLFRSNS